MMPRRKPLLTMEESDRVRMTDCLKGSEGSNRVGLVVLKMVFFQSWVQWSGDDS